MTRPLDGEEDGPPEHDVGAGESTSDPCDPSVGAHGHKVAPSAHRSRLGWPLMQERRAAPRTRRLALVILYVAVALNMVLTALVFSYVTVLKHARDTEQTRIEQRIEQNNCALLDELPYERVLEPLRARYHCGPGLPASKDPE